ncbi:MAG: beta-glucuronidase [Lentisphaerae bacterium]|nr:beta-glucuronidase [Lentisphaerota bacterium]
MSMSTSQPRPEHPRPQFFRPDWINLNGWWSYRFDFGQSGIAQGWQHSTGFEQQILIPFAPESELSGVAYRDFIPAIFYHRIIVIPPEWSGSRILLHFGAVDQIATIYIDGQEISRHYGGSSSFTVDLTESVRPGVEHHLVVQAVDDVRSGLYGGGKQCPDYHSRSCHYTRTTGIWQSVWLEKVALTGLKSCRIIPDLDNGAFIFAPVFHAAEPGNLLQIGVWAGNELAASGKMHPSPGATISLPLEVLETWSPDTPFLYDIRFQLTDASGAEIDYVESYAGMRKISIAGDRIFLNNQPLYQRLVLDQGFYPDGLWTAPSDAALKKDIELSMEAGFNGARLHQKVFEERFHYWADRLGYLTWGEFPSWGLKLANPEAQLNFLVEWSEVVARDANHPSIITWSPLNESYMPDSRYLRGVFPNQEALESYRRFIRRIYNLTKQLDCTRPVNDSSGYLHVLTDLWTVHCYRSNAEKLLQSLFPEDSPVMMHNPEFECGYTGQPYLADEIGGFMFIPPGRSKFTEKSWGYYGLELKNEDEFCTAIAEQVQVLLQEPRIAGFCYTQLTDIEQEQNGIYNYDRTPKAAPHKIRQAINPEGLP